MFYIKWLYGYIFKERKRFYFAMILAVVTGCIAPIGAYISKIIIDTALPTSNHKLLLQLLLLLFIVQIFSITMSYIMQITLERSSQNMLEELRNSLYENLQKLDIPFFNENSAGELMSIFAGDVQLVRHMISWICYQTVYCITVFISGFVVLLNTNVVLALSLFAISPFILFLNIKYSRVMGKLHSKSRHHFSALNKIVSENIDANRVVKAFTNEDFEVEKFQSENQNFKNANINISMTSAKYNILVNILTNSLTLISLFVGAFFVIYNKLTVGELAMFTSLIFTLEYPIRAATTITNDVQRFFTSAKRMMMLLFAQPDVKNPEKPVKDVAFTNEIAFNDVSLKISDNEILSHLNFTIHSGETVAIMGPCGSGKTMIINLLMRYLDVTSGSITVDGVDIRSISLKDLRKNFGIAPQDVFLFSYTIGENVSYENPDLEMQEIEKFAKRASAHDFILKTSEQYDTIVGERGVGLSGGQKQRIALSRALAKDAKMLVLDDTTSALDMETEKEIQKELEKSAGKTTTLIIAGRISSVRHADKIIIVENGTISTIGTHDQLVNKDGYYRDVYNLQIGNTQEVL